MGFWNTLTPNVSLLRRAHEVRLAVFCMRCTEAFFFQDSYEPSSSFALRTKNKALVWCGMTDLYRTVLSHNAFSYTGKQNTSYCNYDVLSKTVLDAAFKHQNDTPNPYGTQTPVLRRFHNTDRGVPVKRPSGKGGLPVHMIRR